MLKIRDEQMAVFCEMTQRAFEARALTYLAHAYPQEFQQRGEDAMRQLIRRTLEQAKSFHLGAEDGVIVWAELSLSYGEDFVHRQPWAPYILNHTELDAKTKVERLRGYLVPSQHQEAEPTQDGRNTGNLHA